MKVKALEIRWHETQPIFSADFHSISAEQHRKVAHPYALVGASSTEEVVEKLKKKEKVEGPEKLWRLATAGGDRLVRLWLVKPRPHLSPSTLKALVPSTSKLSSTNSTSASPQIPVPNFDIIGSPTVEYLATLTKHSAVVNVVRFSPVGETLASAGDDGVIIIWIPGEGTAAFGDSNEDKEYAKESWRVKTMCRPRSGQELYDLAWSPDGSKILVGSVDNTASIFDASTGQLIHTIAEHSNYVQGVAWDPRDNYIATQSSDRSMHIYSLATTPTGLLVQAVGKNARMDIKHKQGGSWSNISSTSSSSKPKAITAPEEQNTSKGKEKEVTTHDQPPPFQRASSRASDSDRSETSSTRPSVTLGGNEDEPTLMDPPFRPSSSRNSSTSGSQTQTTSTSTNQTSPNLQPHSTIPLGLNLGGSSKLPLIRSPSPAPLPAIRYPPSPTLAAAMPNLTANEKINNLKLYGDASSSPFFRRLCWSTDGSLLLTPAGLFEDPYAGVAIANSTPSNSNSTSTDGKKKSRKNPNPISTQATINATGPKPTVYIYSRSNVSKAPIAHLPGHKTTSIAIRFCPVLWKLRSLKKVGEDGEGDDDDCVIVDLVKEGIEVNLNGDAEVESNSKEDKGKGKLVEEEEEEERPNSLFDLPYRMVYAVATLDAVYLYDTQQAGPICMFSNLHYAPFTDLTWTSDGETLIVSSQDGYCSIVAFDPLELGTPYTRLGPHQTVTFNRPAPNVLPIPTPATVHASTGSSSSNQTTLPFANIPGLDLSTASGSSNSKREGEVIVGDDGEQPAKKKKRATLTLMGPIGGGAP